MASPIVHVDETAGQDAETSTGTGASPYKTLQYAYLRHQGADSSTQYLVRKPVEASADGDTSLPEPDNGQYKPAAKSALKKAATLFETQKKKAAREKELQTQREQEERERQTVLERAKLITISEDTSLPRAVKIRLDQTDASVVKLRDNEAVQKGDEMATGTRVRVMGRVHRVRQQGQLIFITLRDGYGYLQCLLSGQLAKTYDAITLTLETSIELLGEMWAVPAFAKAPDNRELHADFFRVIGRAAGGDDSFTNRIAPTSKTAQHKLLDLRHLSLRGENAAKVMLIRDQVEWAFRTAYREDSIRCVSPPALVQTQVEGGATLFSFQYYDEKAFLTQSSQLYLETCLPMLGNVFCIEKSFRAEKSLTRRHLSEFTHVEAELDFITFADLLDHLEHVICRVIDLVLADPAAARMIKDLNPDFTPPSRPFMRMRYADAIDWLRERDVRDEDGNEHFFGADIAEKAERHMTDSIGRPILLTHFPVEIKAFYMSKDPQDRRVTESVDCLMPGVGEIVGGSMRMYEYDELMAAYQREGISPEPYYWYTDQRK